MDTTYTKIQALQIKADFLKEGIKKLVVELAPGQYIAVSPATARAYANEGKAVVNS